MGNKPQKVTWVTNTTNDTSPAYADFPTACSSAYASFDNVTTSTKSVVKLQGSIGGSGIWFDLSAATTLSTASVSFGSTATGVFDRVRVLVSGKTTMASTNAAWIIAKD